MYTYNSCRKWSSINFRMTRKLRSKTMTMLCKSVLYETNNYHETGGEGIKVPKIRNDAVFCFRN